MCGIAGVYNYATDQPVDLTLLLHMSELVAHRGPDDHGFFHDRKIGLAHRRLSVIDLSQAGHQPMSNEDKTAWIVYNGECYNYLDFHKLLHTRRHKIRSNTDAEVILHLYEEYDVDLLGKIDGMFAFAIWDLEKQRLFIARDRIGIKPLFYYQDPQRLLFASELKSLLADPDISREIDYGALGNFFRLMSIPDPNSIFKYIKKLQPGHYLLVEKGKVQVKSYWDISHFRPAAVNNFETACKQFNRHFEETVKSHMIADVPLGAFLSGGVDSSALVAMTSQDRKTPVHTISASFKGLREFDESGFASQVAQKFGTDHQEFQLEPDLMSALPKMVWHADEPFAISSALALYFLSEAASRNLKVILTGDGADEVFAGYPWRHCRRFRLPEFLGHFSRPILNGFDRLSRINGPGTGLSQQGKHAFLRLVSPPGESYDRSFHCFRSYELQSLLTPDLLNTLEREETENVVARFFNRPLNATELARKLYAEIKTTLVSEMLTKVDRMTMAFGLEARVPFLDHHLVEWAFKLPDSYKIQRKEGKYIIKKSMEKYLPRHILYRPKHGFNVPLEVWIRGEIREMVFDLLLGKKLKERGLVRPDAVEKLLNRRFSGHRDFANQVFVLLTLELWFQQFIDRNRGVG